MSLATDRKQPTLSEDYYRGQSWLHYVTINPAGPGLLCICKVTDKKGLRKAINEQIGRGHD